MKKVLIAMDYDPTAQKVAEVGNALAKSIGAEVILLHVITDNTYYSSLEYTTPGGFIGFSDFDSSHLFATHGLQKATMHYLEKVKKHLKNESIKTIVDDGEFAETILNTAKKEHVDFIVMGSHSRRWLEEILVGSVTEQVLKLSKIPLFIVPTKK